MTDELRNELAQWQQEIRQAMPLLRWVTDRLMDAERRTQMCDVLDRFTALLEDPQAFADDPVNPVAVHPRHGGRSSSYTVHPSRWTQFPRSLR